MKKVVILLIIIFLFSCNISAQEDKLIYKCANTEENKIALTFDDGPHPRQTKEILSVLDKYGVKATFFVIAQNATYYPDVLRLIADEGHEIGNHTFSHLDMKKSKNRDIRNEIIKSEDFIYELCHYNTRLFRPPGGVINSEIIETAKELNYKIVLWDIDTRDWAHRGVNEIVNNISDNVKNGSIILFHDYISRNSPTPEALDKIIPLLKEKGFSFVCVSELISNKQRTNAR